MLNNSELIMIHFCAAYTLFKMAMVQQLVENLHPGPIDESLLFLQTKHCSEAAWHDLPERVLQIRRTTTIGHATQQIRDC